MELLGASVQESFPMGHVVHYTCRPGYSRYGATIKMICSEGTWLQVSRGECKKKRCGNPGDIEFGTFELKNEEDFVFGAIVEYSCEPGYQMVSKYNSIECTAGGWSRDLPHCEAKLCPPVVDDSVRVLSTIHDEEYTAGHVINLKCKNPNKKLNGPSQIHCTSNGTWNVDPPTCKEQKLKKQPCFPPPEVLFGEWMRKKKEMYDSGSTIKFKCISYYKLQGKKEIKCRNGTWDQLPACLVPCILNSNYIKGNNTDLVNAKEKYVEHNKNVKFKCLRTFAISDVKLLHVKCLNGTLEYPKCVKMEPCVLNDNYLKGNNTIVNASKKYLEHDETVKFKCLPTFNISDSKLLNGKCLDGKLKYPKCVKMAPDAITVQPSVQSEPNIY